ncbi:MAG: hypothetical protein MJY82_06930 [Fibrobacter sp.]|nr:hypothetical protein [Fibrobacter sp.]
MKRLAALLLAILAVNAFALDPIWRMRYTFGPENKPAPKFGVGVGINSDFGDNVLIPVNIMSSISSEIDLGAKLDVFTYNKMDHTQLSVDVGGRYKISRGSFLELDGYFGLNRNNGSAVILTYASEQFIAKAFSNFYEMRAGFLDGVTGEDGYVKFSLGMTPTLYFGSAFRTMIEVNMSGSAGHLKDDFMTDIIPKLELNFGHTRVRLDFDIGIMQEKNNDQKTIALYVMTAL